MSAREGTEKAPAMSASATPRTHRLVSIGAALYLGGMTVLVTKRWLDWRYGFDDGIFQQCLATVTGGDARGLWQCGHWSPVWLLVAPLFKLWPSGLTLQLLQAVLLGSAVVPAYALARRYLGPAAAPFALLVLFYPPVVAYAYNDVHEAAFVPVLVWGLLWAIDGERYVWFALLAIVAIDVREDASIGLAVFGCALAVHALRTPRGASACGIFTGFRRPRAVALAGGALAIGGATVAALYLWLVHPYEDLGTHLGGLYVYPFARDPRALLVALASDPRHFADVITFEKITYVVRLLAPLAFLPLLSRWSLLALPELCIILLSSNRDLWTPELQYVALLAPWLQFGALAGLHRLQQRSVPLAARWLWTATAVTAAIILFANPMHIGRNQTPAHARADAERAFAALPDGARVALPIPWFARIAARQPHAQPFFCDDVPWALYADDDPDVPVQRIVARLRGEVARGVSTELENFGHVSLYKRTPRAASDKRCTAEF